MMAIIELAPGYEDYVKKTPGLIDPTMTRSVRVNWEVRGVNMIPEGFPWKAAEGSTTETVKRDDLYDSYAIGAELDQLDIPQWALDRCQFLKARRVSSSAILLGLVNQGFAPVKTYAQRRERGVIRLTIVWMDLEKARKHPVAALIDTHQAEAWQHRDITSAMRSQDVVWDQVYGNNNVVWDKGQRFNPSERSIDLTFVGRNELMAHKPREEQIRGVVRVRNHEICVTKD